MSKPVSYSLAFLKHDINRFLGCGALAVGIIASFPMGLDGFTLSMLAFAALEVIGLASISTAPAFRAYVDRREARLESGETRERLAAEIKANGGSTHMAGYQLMRTRVDSLRRTAIDSTTTLTDSDVDQLDGLTIDYLRLCLSESVSKGQDSSQIATAVGKKLNAVLARLKADDVGRDAAAQLNRAKTEYEDTLKRQARMASRSSALDASLVSIPVRVEELYQMVMTAPTSGDLSSMLEESVSRLRFAEKASIDLDDAFSLGNPSKTNTPTKTTPAPPAALARQAVSDRE